MSGAWSGGGQRRIMRANSAAPRRRPRRSMRASGPRPGGAPRWPGRASRGAPRAWSSGRRVLIILIARGGRSKGGALLDPVAATGGCTESCPVGWSGGASTRADARRSEQDPVLGGTAASGTSRTGMGEETGMVPITATYDGGSGRAAAQAPGTELASSPLWEYPAYRIRARRSNAPQGSPRSRAHSGP